MMAKSSTKAKSEYNKRAYEQFALRFNKGEKEKWQAEAEKQGESLNAYIVKAMEMRREQDNVNHNGSDTKTVAENTFHIDNMDLLSQLPLSELIAYINEAVSEKRESDKKKREYALLKESGFFDTDISNLSKSEYAADNSSLISHGLQNLRNIRVDNYGELQLFINAYPSVYKMFRRLNFVDSYNEFVKKEKRSIEEYNKTGHKGSILPLT